MENQDREIARLLSGKGLSWIELSENKKELARKVFSLAKARIDRIAELSEQIKELKFSKQSIAKEIGVSRKTIGSNNPEIAILADLLVNKGKAYWLSYRPNSDSNTIEIMKRRLDLLYARDNELVAKDEQYKKLKDQYDLKEKQYNKVKNDRDELNKKVERLEFELTKFLTPFSGTSGSTKN